METMPLLNTEKLSKTPVAPGQQHCQGSEEIRSVDNLNTYT